MSRLPPLECHPGASAGSIREDPFTLGVTSGDPLPGAAVLWTRPAPKPYEPGGGLPAAAVPARRVLGPLPPSG